jgi:hypothetical protein
MADLEMYFVNTVVSEVHAYQSISHRGEVESGMKYTTVSRFWLRLPALNGSLETRGMVRPTLQDGLGTQM